MKVINNVKFSKLLARHKQLVDKLGRTEDERLFGVVVSTGEELALVYSGYACECCKSEKLLQYHHLIKRDVKRFTDFWKYATQRNYWANVVILCVDCHNIAERRKPRNDNVVPQTIPSEHIDELKKVYEKGGKL